MNIALLGHSIVSDWNHGNAHFFRGLIKALHRKGHAVTFFEPRGAWSRENLKEERGAGSESELLDAFAARFPFVAVRFYDGETDWRETLPAFDAVLVHEWTDTPLVRDFGGMARSLPCPVLYYDTHHQAATEPEKVRPRDLPRFDGVIGFGASHRDLFVREYGTDPERTFSLHEAADAEEFAPPAPGTERIRDLVFVGNWSDDRAEEMGRYFFCPAPELSRDLWGVLYPDAVQARMAERGVRYHGYLPNVEVPRVFGESRVVTHVHRGPYRTHLPGIPTIRMFEAMSCGACLVSSPWEDREGLFPDGTYVALGAGEDPEPVYRALAEDADRRAALGAAARECILSRHTCAHRAEELIGILRGLGARG